VKKPILQHRPMPRKKASRASPQSGPVVRAERVNDVSVLDRTVLFRHSRTPPPWVLVRVKSPAACISEARGASPRDASSS